MALPLRRSSSRDREDQGHSEECGLEFSFCFVHTTENYIVTAREERNVKVVNCVDREFKLDFSNVDGGVHKAMSNFPESRRFSGV